MWTLFGNYVDIRSDEDRTKVDGRTLVNADHPQVIEVEFGVYAI